MASTVRKRILYSAGVIILLGGISVAEYFARKSTSAKAHTVVHEVVTHEQLTSQKLSLPSKTVLLPGGIVGFVVPKAQEGNYRYFEVTDAHRNQAKLDATKRPIFITSYWNNECGDILKSFSKYNIKIPVIVSVAFKPNATFDQGVKLTQKELIDEGIKNATVYYAPNGISSVAAFPSLITTYKGNLVEVLGEVPDPSHWVGLLGKEA